MAVMFPGTEVHANINIIINPRRIPSLKFLFYNKMVFNSIHASKTTSYTKASQFFHKSVFYSLFPRQYVLDPSMITIDINLQDNSRNRNDEDWDNRKNQPIVLPPIQFPQLLDVAQHDFAGKFTLTFLSSAKGEGDFCHAVDWDWGFQEEIKGDFEAMLVDVGRLIELHIRIRGFESESKDGTYFFWIPKKPDMGSETVVKGRASNLAPVEITRRCIGHYVSTFEPPVTEIHLYPSQPQVHTSSLGRRVSFPSANSTSSAPIQEDVVNRRPYKSLPPLLPPGTHAQQHYSIPSQSSSRQS